MGQAAWKQRRDVFKNQNAGNEWLVTKGTKGESMKQNINAKTKKKTESEEEQKQDGERMQD